MGARYCACHIVRRITMHKAKTLFETLLVMTLLICALAFSGAALADGVQVIEFTTYEDGTTTVSSYALAEEGPGYGINEYMAIKPWSFKIDASNSKLSESAVFEACEAGMREWNRYLETPLFSLDDTTGSASIPVKLDGENTIVFDSLSGTALALTRAYISTNRLSDEYPVSKYAVEVDIIFNKDIEWCNVAAGEDGYDLQSIATHELGHTLGLADVRDAAYNYVTMYAYGTRNNIDQRTLSEPDRIGLSKLYKVYGYDDPMKPTAMPSATPEVTPEPSASAEPTLEPTAEPTASPDATPTVEPTVAPTAAPTAEPTLAPTEAPVISATVNTASGGLNMRAAQSAGSTKLTTIPRGATVTVISRGGTWSYVSYGGYTGYVMTQYLKFEGGATAQPSTAPTATPAPGGTSATVIASPRLNMRASANTTSAILTRIDYGATVTVLGTSGEWSNIRYGGYTGYVMTRYLRVGGAPTAAPTQKPTTEPTVGEAIVTASSRLNLRSAMNTSSSILAQIPSGATVGVISYASDWSKVTYNGYTGYVSSQYIAMRSSDNTASETEKPADERVYKTVTITGSASRLNVRAGAGTGYALIAQVPKDARVEVISTSGDWSRISYNGFTGYVMSAYLK